MKTIALAKRDGRINVFFLISPQKGLLWVLIRSASVSLMMLLDVN